jgi:hypothetical protein
LKIKVRGSLNQIYEQEHFVHFYQSEARLFNNLKNFIGAGLKEKAPAVVIAPKAQRAKLDKLLESEGIDIGAQAGNYIWADADQVLEKVMHNGLPNKELFMKEITKLLNSALINESKLQLRAFQSMVALLLERGELESAYLLEQLWNEIAWDCRFTLFCACPAQKGHVEAYSSIGGLHTSVIADNLSLFN